MKCILVVLIFVLIVTATFLMLGKLEYTGPVRVNRTAVYDVDALRIFQRECVAQPNQYLQQNFEYADCLRIKSSLKLEEKK